MALALSVMIGMIVFDLVPEWIEAFSSYHTIGRVGRMALSVFLGFALLKGLDFFVPQHDHEHHQNETCVEEHKTHVMHIGIVTALALFLHNVLEGAAIYNAVLTAVRTGLFMMIGVSLHNIPLGMEIASSMKGQKKSTTTILFIILCISSFLGALFVFILPARVIDAVDGYFVGMSLGMMLYLSIFELLPEWVTHWKERESIIGFLVGILIVLLGFIL